MRESRIQHPASSIQNPESRIRDTSSVLFWILTSGFWILFLPGLSAADWPIFRGNPLQTGVAPAALPDDLEVLWKFSTKDSIEAAVAITGDTAYVPSMDEHLYALDVKTGQQKWKFKSGPFKAPPSVRDGRIYVGDADGKFFCLDTDGKKIWMHDTESEITGGANFVGDAVLFGAADETLYCLSKEGQVRWKFKVPGGPVMASPSVVGDRTFVAGCDSNLHVIDTAKGTGLTAVDLGGQTAATAAIAGDQLFLGTMSNQVVAIDWKKGDVLWKFEAERRQQPFYASAALTADLVIVGCRDKFVYALDRKTGKEVWKFATKNRVDSSPVVAGKRVYVGSLDGNLYVLDVAKGTELKRYELSTKGIVASPAVADGRLIIGTVDGTVYCLGRKK